MIEQVEAKGPTPTTSFHTLSNQDTKATTAASFRGNTQTAADTMLLQGQFELPACEASVSEFPIQAPARV